MRVACSATVEPVSFEPALDRLAGSLAAALATGSSWPEQRTRAARFLALLEAWNARLDLTAARTVEALTEITFGDALVLAHESLVRVGEALLDVGSGGGGPALALALLRDDVRVTLIEPRGKRVAFLRNAIGLLALEARVRVVAARVDPRRPTAPEGGPYDVASSRATFEPSTWARIGLGLAPSVLVFFADQAPPSVGHVDASVVYRLPFSGAPRAVVRLRGERGADP